MCPPENRKSPIKISFTQMREDKGEGKIEFTICGLHFTV
jgi:hypothetical protein